MKYEIIYSRRKTLGLEVKSGRVIARAPYGTPRRVIDSFVQSHEDWAAKKLAAFEAAERKAAEAGILTEEDIQELARKAIEYIPQRVACYAPLVGVSYGKITIRCQRSRWGSCSSKGDLSFNCLLMLAPARVIDAIVVHELCHRKHMDHSKKFYDLLRSVCPDYDECRRWLKQNGQSLLKRVK